MNWFWLICIELEWSRTPTTVSRQRTLHCSDLICLSTPSCTDHVDKDGSRNCVMNSLIACDINASYLSMDNLNGSAPSPLQCTDAENLTYSFSKTDEHAQLMSIITILQNTGKTCNNKRTQIHNQSNASVHEWRHGHDCEVGFGNCRASRYSFICSYRFCSRFDIILQMH